MATFPQSVLSSASMLLRRHAAGDEDLVRRIFADDPDVLRFVAWQPKTNADAAARFLRNLTGGWERERPSWWITRRSDGCVVGSIIAALEGATVEVSYVVERGSWGRGHATEALKIVAAAALEDPRVARVCAFCDEENTGSIRVLEKAGFTLFQRLSEHGVHNVSTEPRDCRLYVLDEGGFA